MSFQKQEHQEESSSRRDLFRHVGIAASAIALSGGVLGMARKVGAQDMAASETPMVMEGMTPSADSGNTVPVPGATAENPFGTLANLSSDLEIFNFALILEHLEAEFYARVVAANAVRPYLTSRVSLAAQKLASDEAIHVTSIIARIREQGGTPITKPDFQFPTNVFVSETGFLTLSTALEETGVGAYLGAAPLVKRRDNLRYAASIYGIEARHTGLIRLLSGRIIAPDAKEMPLTALQVVERAKPYIVFNSSTSPMMDGSMPSPSMSSPSISSPSM